TDRAARHHTSNEQPGLASSGRGSDPQTPHHMLFGLATEIRRLIQLLEQDYRGDKYHLINENSNGEQSIV
ncbi:hypothetical protein AAVH_31971, partial [Aphelenchoides avenae]